MSVYKAKKPAKIDILGVSFTYDSFDGVLSKALGYLKGNKPRTIFTPNPEIVMMARKNAELCAVLNASDIVTPDGIGIVLASKLGFHKFKERVSGYDLALAIFAGIKDEKYTVYFFGGQPGVAEAAKLNMEKEYPGLKIVGVCNGYIKESEEDSLLAEIRHLKPDILLVGTGSPRQELWISKNKSQLPCKLLMGVGGSLDGWGGRVKRAPEFIRKLYLEWLYRLIKEPSRLKRQIQLPLFMIAAIRDKAAEK